MSLKQTHLCSHPEYLLHFLQKLHNAVMQEYNVWDNPHNLHSTMKYIDYISRTSNYNNQILTELPLSTLKRAFFFYRYTYSQNTKWLPNFCQSQTVQEVVKIYITILSGVRICVLPENYRQTDHKNKPPWIFYQLHLLHHVVKKDGTKHKYYLVI